MTSVNDPAGVRELLARCFADGVFDEQEAASALAEIRRDGVSPAEVEAVVRSFRDVLVAPSAGLDASTALRRATTNDFLNQLDALCQLPVDISAATHSPDGGLDFVAVIGAQQDQTARPLAEPAFDGRPVGLTADGQLTLDGQALALDLLHPDRDLRAALQALARPDALARQPASARQALATRLLEGLRATLPLTRESPERFERSAAALAALGAVAELRAALAPAQHHELLALYPLLPAPLAQAILLRALQDAPLDPQQAVARDRLTAPAGGAALLEHYDKAREDRAFASYIDGHALAAGAYLTGLAFARDEAAAGNLLAAVHVWASLEGGEYSGWEPAEFEQYERVLKAYVEDNGQLTYAYGSLVHDTPKEVAAIRSARLVAALTPGLRAEPPALAGYPLTRPQADYLLNIIQKARDEESIGAIKRCLDLARQALGGPASEAGGIPATRPLGPAAFAFFQRAADEFQRGLAAEPTGTLDYRDLERALGEPAAQLAHVTSAALGSLAADPPSLAGVPVGPEVARYLQRVLEHNLRSAMTVDNLGRAVQVYAAAHGGRLDGSALPALSGLINAYTAQWAGEQFFDFNKLERLAQCEVAGKAWPVFSVNGQDTGMGRFFASVGRQVVGALDRSAFRQPWMADRYGFRAAQAAELLDVVAEASLRGEGPLPALKTRHPGCELAIEFTGRDGGHEQFVYVVSQAGRRVARYNQGSDGGLRPYTFNYGSPVFSARVAADGGLQVTVPTPLPLRRYPLQEDYGVGDSIDIEYYDSRARERQKEGEPFSTRHRVLEGRVTGFTADGKYTVSFTDPAGRAQSKTYALGDLRKWNNPHYFSPKNASFSDVNIKVDADQPLKDFLAGAQPIIDRHLPADGSLVGLSAQELTRRQKDCIAALEAYAAEAMQYPDDEGKGADEASVTYHRLINASTSVKRVPLGKLLEIKRGVCRHQCIVEHLLLQQAGIDSRLASGAANTSSGDFRGYHIWVEVTLADGERYLSDQTWSDVTIPLWNGAYDSDKRRLEMYDRTQRYTTYIVDE